MFHFICQANPAIDQLTQLGAAGLMGAMWLWERRTSRQREHQLDEAHTRIISDRVMLTELMDVVRANTQAITRLTQLTMSRAPGSLEQEIDHEAK